MRTIGVVFESFDTIILLQNLFSNCEFHYVYLGSSTEGEKLESLPDIFLSKDSTEQLVDSLVSPRTLCLFSKLDNVEYVVKNLLQSDDICILSNTFFSSSSLFELTPVATINKVNLVDLSVHVGIVEMSPLYYQYGVDNPEINVFDGHDFHNSSFRCLYGIPSITSDIFRCIDCVMTSVVSEIKRILINSFKLENEKITEIFTSWFNGELKLSYLLENGAASVDYQWLPSILSSSSLDGSMLSFLSRLHCDSSMFLASLFLHRSRQQLQSQSTSVLKMCTPHEVPPVDISQILVDCEDALYSCCIVCFVEALNLVSSALAQYDFDSQLLPSMIEVMRISKVLNCPAFEEVIAALERFSVNDILLDPSLLASLSRRLNSLRRIVTYSIACGYPCPVCFAALSRLDIIAHISS